MNRSSDTESVALYWARQRKEGILNLVKICAILFSTCHETVLLNAK